MFDHQAAIWKAREPAWEGWMRRKTDPTPSLLQN